MSPVLTAREQADARWGLTRQRTGAPARAEAMLRVLKELAGADGIVAVELDTLARRVGCGHRQAVYARDLLLKSGAIERFTVGCYVPDRIYRVGGGSS